MAKDTKESLENKINILKKEYKETNNLYTLDIIKELELKLSRLTFTFKSGIKDYLPKPTKKVDKPIKQKVRYIPSKIEPNKSFMDNRRIIEVKTGNMYIIRVLSKFYVPKFYTNYPKIQFKVTKFRKAVISKKKASYYDTALKLFPDIEVINAYRLKMTPLHHKYLDYYKRITKKGLEITLPFKDFCNMLKQPCHYCGGKTNSIDRIDSKKGYTINNCVPACKLCNTIKWDLPKDVWFAHMKRILNFTGQI